MGTNFKAGLHGSTKKARHFRHAFSQLLKQTLTSYNILVQESPHYDYYGINMTETQIGLSSEPFEELLPLLSSFLPGSTVMPYLAALQNRGRVNAEMPGDLAGSPVTAVGMGDDFSFTNSTASLKEAPLLRISGGEHPGPEILDIFGQIFAGKDIARNRHYQSFYDVFQFTHIAGPVVIHEYVDDIREQLFLHIVFPVEQLDEVGRQESISSLRALRGEDLNRYYIEAIVRSSRNC